MAIYVPLRKTLDEANIAEYVYFVEVYVQDEHRPKRNKLHCTKFGRLRVHKESGCIDSIMPMIGDENKFVFAVATRVVHKHWQERQYPEETCYAA